MDVIDKTISTPFKLIDSTLLMVTISQVGSDFVISDEGQTWEVITAFLQEDSAGIRRLFIAYADSEGIDVMGHELCLTKTVSHEKLIGSAIFDLGTFAVQISGATHFDLRS